MIKRYHNCYIWFLNLIKAAFFKLLVQSTSAVIVMRQDGSTLLELALSYWGL